MFPRRRTLSLTANRLLSQPVGWTLTVALMVLLALGVALHVHHESIGFWWGKLATANEQYLDGSHRLFQRGSYHLGNGTRTWGETYGLKVGRFYLTMGVTHTDPSVPPDEANEE